MSITEHAGVFWRREGCVRRFIFTCKQARRTACTKQQEKVKTDKFVVVRKVAKNDKNGKQHKMFKKIRKKEKRKQNKKRNTKTCYPKSIGKRKQTETTKNCVKQGILVTKDSATTNSAN